jgi:hypothetical protein
MSWTVTVDNGRDSEPQRRGWLNASSGKSDYVLSLHIFPYPVFAFEDDGAYRLSRRDEYDGKTKWLDMGKMRPDGDGFIINIPDLPFTYEARPFQSDRTERKREPW